MRSSGGDCLIVRGLSVKSGFDGRGAISFCRHPGDADTRISTSAVLIERGGCLDADDGKTRRRVMHLDVRLPGPAAAFVDANLSQYLARSQRGRHQVDKKIVCTDRPLSILAGRDNFGVERND